MERKGRDRGGRPGGEEANGGVSDLTLWLGAFGAAGAWTIHLLFGVAFGSASCIEAGGQISRFGTPWWVLAGVTAVLLTVAVGSTLLSVRNLHRLGVGPGQTTGAEDGPRARAVFLAFAGLLLGGMFLIALGFSTVAALSVPLCG